jgi:hypothetical protein
MHQKFSFSRKPSDVYTIVRRLREDYQRRGVISPVGTDFGSVYPDAPRVEVKLHEQRRGVFGIGVPPISRTIIADRLTNRRTMITLDIPDDEWPVLEPSWEIFAAELQRFGRLEVWQKEPPRRRPAGMHEGTESKLEELLALRDSSIKDGRVTLDLTAACAQAAIDARTAEKYIPDLKKRWREPDYHPRLPNVKQNG